MKFEAIAIIGYSCIMPGALTPKQLLDNSLQNKICFSPALRENWGVNLEFYLHKEAGICESAKQLLANADMTDVEMASTADMFELGVKLQVLKRGSLFIRRASKLYQYYKNYKSIEDIPLQETQFLEKDIFRESLDVVWKNMKNFFNTRDPKQIAIAARDPKYKMALIFRAYLGQASRWPMVGEMLHASMITNYGVV